MALVLLTLQSNLKKVFSDMKNSGKNAKDTDFSDGISKAVKDYAESGTIVTTDAGTVSAGVFAGGGTGSISVTQSDMSSPIVTAMNSMKNMTTGGDSVLATAIFNGLNAMISKGKVSTDVVGVTTSPTGSPVPPSSGKAEGKMVCTYPTFVTSLNSIFSNMKSKYKDAGFDGDVYLGNELGKLIDSYIKTGVVSTNGKDALSGTAGAGGIS